MVLGKLPVPGRPTILITEGQEPIALAVGAGGVGLDIFTKFNAYFNFLNFLQPYNHHYLNVLLYFSKKNNEEAGSVV